jgi:hypothetical protein
VKKRLHAFDLFQQRHAPLALPLAVELNVVWARRLWPRSLGT